jgi:hypothetical protein
MAELPIDRLKAQLLISGIQQTNPPLFQVIDQLIEFLQSSVKTSSKQGPGGGTGVSNQTFLTSNNESGTLPNSRKLIAGDAIEFDDTTPGEKTVNVKVDGVSVLLNLSNELSAVGGGGGSLVRESTSFQTGIIASGATGSGSFTVTGGWESAELLRVESDGGGYLVLYASAAERAADTRTLPAITDPPAGVGILLDCAFNIGGGLINISPPVVLYNSETPVDIGYYYKFYNAELSSYDTEISLTYVGFQ